MSEALSPQELFKLRVVLDKSVPQRGGDKEYMPDGSWLQDKCIENFHQERQRALAEPRVQRQSDYVQGEWSYHKRLVELSREMRNFWEVMGFTDDKRKWLHPEEALFLIEINVLQLWCKGLPLSIQEAYSLMLAGSTMLEFYQVYAHLRRIGYVVLRHRGRSVFSKYEQKIGLDKHASKKPRKRKGQEQKQLANKSVEDNIMSTTSSGNIEKKVETEHTSTHVPVKIVDQEYHMKTISTKHNEISNNGLPRITVLSETSKEEEKKLPLDEASLEKMEVDQEHITNTNTDEVEPSTKYSRHFMQTSKTTDRNIQLNTTTSVPQWDFDEIVFPNFSCTGDTVTVQKTDSRFIPGQFEVSSNEYNFTKLQYINTKHEKRKFIEQDKKLKFSYQDTMRQSLEAAQKCKSWSEYKALIQSFKCKNWTEYKAMIPELANSESRERELPNLYMTDLQPVVDPLHATSTSDVLNQLQVIEEEHLSSKSGLKPAVVPQFDVYTPNTKFKKSMPGTPDFRILISRSTDGPPDLKTVTDIGQYLNDDVALHVAVVDSGDIAFFSVSDFTVPVDISFG